MSLRRIGYMMRKEFSQVWRDRRLRIFIFLPPLIQLIIYGYAINFDITRVPTAIYDEDHSQESHALISRLTASPYFQVNHYIGHRSELYDLIDHGEVSLAVHIPDDFARQLKSGRSAALQLIFDATDSNTALIVAQYLTSILNDYSQEILYKRLRPLGISGRPGATVVLEPQALFNPNLISRAAFVPGVIAMVVLLVSLMLTALSVVREKEIGTMEQILVTPIRPVEFLLGKTLPFCLLSLVDVALVSVMGIYWFEIPFQGSIAVLFIGTVAFLFNSTGLGLFISTVSATQQQAVMAGTFILTPAILLSGLIFPIANMPEFFQYVTYLNPLRYFITVVQGIFLKGVGLGNLWPEMAAMTGLGLAWLALSVFRFQTRLT